MFELKSSGRLLDGVELLTLSACNTAAIQADADGKEIDGSWPNALGANAVIATLWQVSDCQLPG